MISLVKGILYEQDMDRLIIDVNGIGYQVLIHPRVALKLPPTGNPVLLHTHLQVLENEFKLYGFLDAQELQLFETLLGVSGIGARGALNILGSMEPGSFSRAIASSDEKTLTAIPGIGKKTAQRLIFELRDKINGFPSSPPAESENINDLLEALEVLGYSRSETLPLIMELEQKQELAKNIEDNIKIVLKTKARLLKR
ncbi:MAG: Holliday junction branch migration protein RuvA [Syntrophomonas sp.]